jgi:putative transposase
MKLSIPTRGYACLRRGRSSEAGRAYLLTTVTYERRAVFADWGAARWLSALMPDQTIWQESRLLCWVLMPDHWHGLVQLSPEDSLPGCMRRFKGRMAWHLRQNVQRHGPLWAPGYHDHALRREEDLRDAARYIVANPVRAGLVPRAGLYPFWDAVWL